MPDSTYSPSWDCCKGLSLLVFVKDVFGRPTIYPANQTACVLTDLLGTSTLTPRVLRLLLKSGASVKSIDNSGAALDRLLTGEVENA